MQQAAVAHLLERSVVDLDEMVSMFQSVMSGPVSLVFLPAIDVALDALAVPNDKVFNSSHI
jgi:hypothetical protein